MQYYQKMDKYQIAQTNKYNVFRCLSRNRPINRSAIANVTDLSIPTVMSIVDDFLSKGIVRSIGKGESAGGKPPEMLEIVPDRFYYIGLDVGSTKIRIVANNFNIQQIASFQEPTNIHMPTKQFVDHLCKMIIDFATQLNTDLKQILGIGIAMPGLIEKETGRVIFSPDFKWHNVPLKDWLQEKLPFPVVVENANRTLALNEAYIPGEEDHTVFSINLGYGIGAGLIIGEDIYTGASGTSGEIGHIVLKNNGPLCQCGNKGCLEALASGEAIAQQARQLIKRKVPSIIGELVQNDISRIDAKVVFKASEMGDKAARKIVDTAAKYIGIGLSMAVNILDPDKVILCGGLTKNGEEFVKKIIINMQKHKMRNSSRHMVISIGTKGEYSTANGACQMLANFLWWQRLLPF